MCNSPWRKLGTLHFMRIPFSRTLTIIATLLLAPIAHAEVIISTDFTGRTVSGKTASNIPWITNGVSNPGNLTWIPELPQATTSASAPLFDTGNAADHFAPQRNILNQGAWSVTIPLSLTGSQITLENVVLDWQHFNGSGNYQSINTGLDAITINGLIGTGGGGDFTPPSPDPMTFVETPTATGQFAVTMTATTASDASGVEYFFTNTTLATNSGWQDSSFWTDTGLSHPH